MKWLKRYWSQNRKKIILTVAIIAFIIVMIQITNSILDNRRKTNEEQIVKNKYEPTQSIITGEVVAEEVTKSNIEIINQFVMYCNNREYQNAFELLSNNCQEVVFNNDINRFIQEYCNANFETTKTYHLDLWLNTSNIYTYKIKYYQDNILATGGQNLEQGTEDTISITKQNGEEKLSIKGFIDKKEINKYLNQENLQIEIKDRRIYKDYEIYTIIMKNNSQNTILIADEKANGNICIVDNQNVEYESFLYEIAPEELKITPGNIIITQIRFNKIYSFNRNIEKVRFKDIILNYQENPTTIMENDIKTTTIDIEI